MVPGIEAMFLTRTEGVLQQPQMPIPSEPLANSHGDLGQHFMFGRYPSLVALGRVLPYSRSPHSSSSVRPTGAGEPGAAVPAVGELPEPSATREDSEGSRMV